MALGDLLDLVRPERAIGNGGPTQVEIPQLATSSNSLREVRFRQPDDDRRQAVQEAQPDARLTGRASGRSRTDNPRITNAVLCQLKLRWRGESRKRQTIVAVQPTRPSYALLRDRAESVKGVASREAGVGSGRCWDEWPTGESLGTRRRKLGEIGVFFIWLIAGERFCTPG